MKFLFYVARIGLFRKLPIQSTHCADEVYLWRAVIDQALHDVGSKRRKKQYEALSWFDLDNEDFVEVCTYAMLDPEEVMRVFNSTLKELALKNKRLPDVRHIKLLP